MRVIHWRHTRHAELSTIRRITRITVGAVLRIAIGAIRRVTTIGAIGRVAVGRRIAIGHHFALWWSRHRVAISTATAHPMLPMLSMLAVLTMRAMRTRWRRRVEKAAMGWIARLRRSEGISSRWSKGILMIRRIRVRTGTPKWH